MAIMTQIRVFFITSTVLTIFLHPTFAAVDSINAPPLPLPNPILNGGGLNLNLNSIGDEPAYDIDPSSPLAGFPSDVAEQIAKTIDTARRQAAGAGAVQTPQQQNVAPPAASDATVPQCVQIYRRCSTRPRTRTCCSPNTCQESEGAGSETFCLPPKQQNSTVQTGGGGGEEGTKCPYTARIEQILEPLRDGEEFNRTVEYLAHHKLEYIKKTAFRGDVTRNYQMTIRDIHLLMRENYRNMITAIGNNIYPLIIASDAEPGSVSGVGGTFTLYLEDGSMKRITPTSPMFEMYKNLAHMPLGIFTIVSPYFLTPEAPTWQPAMRTMQTRVQDAITAASLGPLKLADQVRDHSLRMLTLTSNYIKTWLARGKVTVDDFEKYTREMIPFVEHNIKIAAQLQVQALLPHLQKWKDELGDKWKDVYALIPTIWPVSAINPRMQVLSQLMSPEQVKGQVLLLENAGTVLDQRATLGRILGDRAAALMILGTQTKSQTRLTFALSTKQDLLANSCSDAITAFFDGIRVKRK